MPKYLVVRDEDACSASKPWAVKTQGGPGDGNIHGCFKTKALAREQQKAIYASITQNNAEAAMNKEHRAYTQAQVDELGKAGKAFRNADGSYSYPIDNTADLKRAIRAVGRGNADHDAIRKFVIKRANSLGQRDLIPDSWAADGSIKESNAKPWTDEQRDTANDMWTALDGAVTDSFGDEYSWNTWVQDWGGSGTDDDPYVCVFYNRGDIYAVDFSFDDDNKIVMDTEGAVKVRPVTSYIPRSQRAADDTCTTCDGTGQASDADCPDCAATGERGATEPEKREAAKPVLKQTMAFRKAKMPKKGEREVRTLPIESLQIDEMEVRAADGDGEQRLLEFNGHASVFNRSYSVGPYEEEIAPGAFTRSLGNPGLDTVLRIEHKDLPLARTTGTVTLPDGTVQPTLQLSEDESGLHVRALLDPTDPDVQRIVPKMKRGDLKEMSFAFRSTDDLWSDDYSHRTIRGAEIHRGDVAIVTYGASPTTTSSLRSEEAIHALHSFGAERLFAALTEWRDFTLTPVEEREGKALSSASMEVLERVLQLVSNADDAVDEAQPLLADLMGVPDPDSDDERSEDDVDDESGGTERSGGEPDTPVVSEPETRSDEFELRAARARADAAMVEAELLLMRGEPR